MPMPALVASMVLAGVLGPRVISGIPTLNAPKEAAAPMAG
jgi:hypothetical protein